MANDPNLKQKVDFSGKLDLDTDLVKVKPNDYVSARNVQFLTNDTQSTRSHIPMLGNELAFNLGSVGTQNKRWRIYTPQDATSDLGGLFLYDQNGNLFPTINGQAQPMEWDRNQTMANQRTDIESMFGTIEGTGNTVVTVVGDYIDITTNTIAGYDLGLEARTATHATPILITDTVMDAEIMAEAYDITLNGEMQDIASNDLQGDLMILSTPQKYMPTAITPTITTVTIVAAGAPVNFQYRVTTSAAHGLSTGMKVVISGVNVATPGVVSPNGTWIVTVIGATTFNLTEWYNTTTGFTQGAAGGTVTLYTESIGEIGVGQKDVNTGTWTYTRLLRTKAWDFRTQRQPDFRVSERTTIKDSHYWTNDYEVMRCFYYKHPYTTDGAIEQIDPNGYYSYKTVGEETKLLLSATNSRIAFTTQEQGGGQVASGNWRYTIRFLADSLAATEWADLTNPVNVYLAASNGDPSLIIGNAPGTVTSKINNLEVTGITPGLFKYIELAGVNYVGDAVEGFILKRVLLDGVSTTIDISHTGTEADVINLDLGTLNIKNAPIVTAKNMDVVDKRLVVSNVTLAQITDLSAWAQTFKHSLIQKTIDSVKVATLGTLRMAEYQDPENVNGFMGLMQNETYRFAVKVRFKDTGYISQAFHVDDVIINTEPTNAASSDPARRVSGLPNFNLTDFTGAASPNFDTTTVYVPYIQFSNIDLDYEIDGVKVRDMIDGFTIERAEVTNPTILACGYAIPSIEEVNVELIASGGAVNVGYTYNGNITYFPVAPNGGTNGMGEFPFTSGRVAAAANPLYSAAEFTGLGKDAAVVAFYSPDIQFGHSSISWAAGDKLLNHGNPINPNFLAENSTPGSYVSSQMGQWNGFFNTSGTTPNVIESKDIDEAVFVEYGGEVSLQSGKIYKKYAALFNGNAGNTEYSINKMDGSMVIECTSGLTVFGTQSDYGFYYCQYYRPLTDQYGDTNTTKYVSCGNYFEVDSTVIGLQSLAVYGGDTFTQLNYLRNRQFALGGEDFAGSGFGPYATDLPGFAAGLSLYCQNRINAQMKEKSAGQTGDLYPGIPTVDWLESPSNTDGNHGEAYQEGYTIRNQVRSDVAFDSALQQFYDLPVTIFWSDIKLEDSPTDGYRKMLPLNRHDLVSTDGELVHHGKSNSELITWQWRAVQRQNFNSRGQLEIKNITQIVLGNGEVMNRDGVTLSRFGSLNKWAIIHGVTANGDDVYMWINTEMKNVGHYAADGTLTLSDEWMKSFFANNLTWVEGKDMPAHEEGICGVYNQRFNDFIWTVRGRRDTENTYSAAVNYSSIGDLVYYRPATFSTFEETGELFLVKFASGPATVVVTPVAVYPLPNVVSTLTGTTVLTITTASPHLLVTGDQVKFRDIDGLSTDINETFHTVTVTGASTFTITVSALTNSYTASSGSIVEVNPKYWTFIPHTNNQYYNEYTVVFNGFKYGFTTTASFLPRIYNQWRNGFLSPRPISPVSKVYEHNQGDYLTWYLDSSVAQEEEGYIEAVINKYEDQSKWYGPIGVDSEIVPERIDFATRNHVSYLEDTEFEEFEESFFSPIKGDSTVTADNPTGLNDLDTSLLWGKYMKAKFVFAVGVYQKLSSFVVNFQISNLVK